MLSNEICISKWHRVDQAHPRTRSASLLPQGHKRRNGVEKEKIAFSSIINPEGPRLLLTNIFEESKIAGNLITEAHKLWRNGYVPSKVIHSSESFLPVAENKYWHGDFKLLGSPRHVPADILEQTFLKVKYEQKMVKISEAPCMFIDGKTKVQEDSHGLGWHFSQAGTDHRSRSAVTAQVHCSSRREAAVKWAFNSQWKTRGSLS